MLNLEYSLEKEEFQDAIFYCNWEAPERKKDRRKYYLGHLSYFLVIVAFFAFGIRLNFHWPPFLLFVLLVGAVYYYSAFSPKPMYQNLTDSLINNEGGNETILYRRELFIDETGILIKSNTASLKYFWNAITQKIEQKNCYYLFISSRDPIIIPKRAFIDKNDQVKFIEYLTKYLPLSSDPVFSNAS